MDQLMFCRQTGLIVDQFVCQFRAASEGGSAGAGADAVGNSAFSRNSITKEQQLSTALRRSLPGITYVSVQDISGGCGAMFEVNSLTISHFLSTQLFSANLKQVCFFNR